MFVNAPRFVFRTNPTSFKHYNSVHYQSRKEDRKEMIFEYLTNARENFFSKTGDNSIVKSNIEEFTGKAERFCDTLNK